MSEKAIGERIVSVRYKKEGIELGFASGNKLVLSADTFTEFHLYEGKYLTEEELSALLHATNEDAYYSLALKWLTKHVLTEAEVTDKLLAKEVDEDTIYGIIKRLKDQKLIDDEVYARTYAKDVGALRYYGKDKILFELRRKGIPESILKDLKFKEENEREKAFRYASFLNRKYISPSLKKKQKAYAALLQRGFDEDIAREAVEACVVPPEAEVESRLLERHYRLARAKYARKYGGYELNQHIYASLRKKGFRHEEIKAAMAKGEEE